MLADAARRGATHISVVNKMLQDMLAAPNADQLRRYVCILSLIHILIPGKPLVVAYSMGGRVALSALLEVGPAAFAKQTSGLLLELSLIHI